MCLKQLISLTYSILPSAWEGPMVFPGRVQARVLMFSMDIIGKTLASYGFKPEGRILQSFIFVILILWGGSLCYGRPLIEGEKAVFSWTDAENTSQIVNVIVLRNLTDGKIEVAHPALLKRAIDRLHSELAVLTVNEEYLRGTSLPVPSDPIEELLFIRSLYQQTWKRTNPDGILCQPKSTADYLGNEAVMRAVYDGEDVIKRILKEMSDIGFFSPETRYKKVLEEGTVRWLPYADKVGDEKKFLKVIVVGREGDNLIVTPRNLFQLAIYTDKPDLAAAVIPEAKLIRSTNSPDGNLITPKDVDLSANVTSRLLKKLQQIYDCRGKQIRTRDYIDNWKIISGICEGRIEMFFRFKDHFDSDAVGGCPEVLLRTGELVGGAIRDLANSPKPDIELEYLLNYLLGPRYTVHGQR
jgi:hypothetical protein